MTNSHNVTVKSDSNGRIPSPSLQQYVDAANSNSHFAALSEPEKLAYVRLLIEAEEWAKDFGFKRTYMDHLRKEVSDD